MRSKFLILFTLILGLYSSAFADESFANLYPENTALFIEFNNTSPANSDFHKTAFYDMLNEQQTQQFLAHAEKKLAEITNMAAIMTMGVKIDDILTAFGNHVSMGLFTKDSMSNILIVAEFPKSVNPVQLLAPINPDGPDAMEFNLSFPIDQNNPKQIFALKVKGQMLYLTITQDSELLSLNIRQKPSSLATTSDFLRASSKIGQNRLFTAYINPFLYDLIQTLNFEMDLEMDFSAIYPEQFNTAAFSVCIDEPAFIQRTYLKTPSMSFPYDILSEPDINQLSFVTSDATSMVTYGLDIKQAIEVIIDTMIKTNPETLAMSPEERTQLYYYMIEEINNTMAAIKEDYGVDPLQDIIENLGKNMTMYNQTTDRLPGLELFGFGASTFIVSVRDREELEQSLARSTDALITLLEDQAASRLEFQTDYGIIKGITLANSFTFCYLFVDDSIIFSLNPSAIDYALIQRNANQNIISSPAFAELQELINNTAAKSGVSGSPVRVGFMKVDGISDLLNNTIALGASVGGIIFSTQEAQKVREMNNGQLPFSPIPNPSINPPAFIKYLGELFPIYLLPSKGVINQHVFDTWNAGYITPENEYVEITYGPFPFDNTFFTRDFGKLARLAGFGAIGAALPGLVENPPLPDLE